MEKPLNNKRRDNIIFRREHLRRKHVLVSKTWKRIVQIQEGRSFQWNLLSRLGDSWITRLQEWISVHRKFKKYEKTWLWRVSLLGWDH